LVKRNEGTPGTQKVSWDATGKASGIYLALVEVQGSNGGILRKQAVKVMVLR
jgi:hypothetical protein